MAPVDDGLQPPRVRLDRSKNAGEPRLVLRWRLREKAQERSRYLMLALVALGPMKASRGGGTLLSDSVGNDPPVLARRGPQT